MYDLTYNDQPLLLDQGGQASGFLNRYQPLAETLPYIADSIFRQDGKEGPLGQSHVGLASPNYPPPPPPRLNELYWPTGAARWARAFFLITKTVRDELVKSLDQSHWLQWGDGAVFKVKLYALPPRPVSSVENAETLWLLPLVDQRYYWQFANLADLEQADVTTWADLFTWIETQLQLQSPNLSLTVDAVDAAYQSPDKDECARRFRNVPQLFDAAAHSVARVVVQHNGDVQVKGWDNSVTELTENLTTKSRQWQGKGDEWYQIAGDDYSDSLVVPDSVDIVFPKCINTMLQRKKRVYQINKEVSDKSSHTALPAIKKTIHTTHWASYVTETLTDCTNPAPDNTADCEALADLIATDYYLSIDKAYDYTFLGVKDWLFTGYDDHALYYLGGEESTPSPVQTAVTPVDDQMQGGAPQLVGSYPRRFLTRIQSMPQNFGVEDLLHQSVDITFRPLGLQILIVHTPVGGIPAKAAGVVGSATCTLRFIDDQDALQDYLDDAGDPEEIVVKNLSATAIDGDVDIQVQQELCSGKVLGDWEDC